MSDDVVSVHIESEMRQSYLDYAMSVIIGRALPDVRDGLKPVQRRVLYALFSEGLLSNRKHSKCAGVVGEVLKRLHPHGDMPVYEALVRLAQPWNLRYPLIDGQGNFGSIDGDPPAAYRYTECRMTSLAESLLSDIDKDTVDFIPNFDETTDEPVVLPTRIPNLLVNGADGIAVGMATHIPPHNLSEVVSAATALIENPDIKLKDLMSHMSGPDFPTGGIIVGKDAIISAYKTGRGLVRLRGKTYIETLKHKTREVEAIIISEVPYQVNKARLIEKIAGLVNEKKIDGVSKIRDESDRKGMRVVIELKRDATNEVVLNQLFKLTPLQTTFGIINLAIVEGKPQVCSLKTLLQHFVDYRRDIVTRRSQYELRKAQDRMHILEGFMIALINIDDIIALIKASQTPPEAKVGLVNKFELSEIQAQAILELRLQRLTGMERLAIEKEKEELAEEIKKLLGILGNIQEVDKIIVSELNEIKDKYADERRTEIIEGSTDINIEDLIEDEEVVITLSHQGYIKRTSIQNYRAQKRGGKGVSGAASKQDDFIEHLFVSTNLSTLLVFTDQGRAYCLKVHQLPEGGRTARGRALVNLLNLKENEKIAAVLPIREFGESQYILFCTENGIVKKSPLMDFANVRKSGLAAITLRDQDALIEVSISSGDSYVILSTHLGMSVRFPEDDIRPTGRGASGVRGIKLRKDDYVVDMTIAEPHTDDSKEEPSLLTVCENGLGKRTYLSEFPERRRGGIGVKGVKISERNGPVVGACMVTNESQLLLMTYLGQTIRINASDISVVGRVSQGVKVISPEEGDRVVAVALVVESDEEQA